MNEQTKAVLHLRPPRGNGLFQKEQMLDEFSICKILISRIAAGKRHRISSVTNTDQGIVGGLDPIDEIAW